MADSNSKQDIVVKIREHDQEILQLKKHLSEYSIKAFDQQQQDLILAAPKAISYRQDIMEENIRLMYALQAAQQERSTFITSLMPLITEYSLQPPVADAQSIVSNVKDRDDQDTVIALRPIVEEEEIIISYIGEDLPYKERQELLADYGFRCKFSKCVT